MSSVPFAICVGLSIRKDEGKEERSSLLSCFSVLPSAAQPCSLVCQPFPWPFGATVWKAPLQSAGADTGPAVGPGLSKPAPNFGVGQEVLRELPGPCRSEEGCSLGVTYQPCRSLPSCWETNAGEDRSVSLSCCVPVTMCDCEAALTHSGT